ncbi:MAG: hypothetical protein ACJ8DI_26935 [Ktedonobacteraceae bacterium]
MDKEGQHHSELFTVRLWQEEQGNDQVTWRGKVQHVTSGEARYFHDWSTLIAFLLRWLPGSGTHSDAD